MQTAVELPDKVKVDTTSTRQAAAKEPSTPILAPQPDEQLGPQPSADTMPIPEDQVPATPLASTPIERTPAPARRQEKAKAGAKSSIELKDRLIDNTAVTVDRIITGLTDWYHDRNSVRKNDISARIRELEKLNDPQEAHKRGIIIQVELMGSLQNMANRLESSVSKREANKRTAAGNNDSKKFPGYFRYGDGSLSTAIEVIGGEIKLDRRFIRIRKDQQRIMLDHEQAHLEGGDEETALSAPLDKINEISELVKHRRYMSRNYISLITTPEYLDFVDSEIEYRTILMEYEQFKQDLNALNQFIENLERKNAN